jgi:hypothetical protein
VSISYHSSRLNFGPSLGRLLGLALGLCLFSACGGGAHGFARTYKPLAGEQRHFEEAQQLTYQDLVREPNAYKNVEVGWFGVVTDMQTQPDGRTRLVLSLRAHQPRHLCSDESASSCRVTVSTTSLGTFSADLALKPAELAGKERIWQGSLLKIYGVPTGQSDESTGPILDVKYHRHWPRGYYVTTAQRAEMRR